MAAFYDARGNTYFVASPEEVGGFADLPRTASEFDERDGRLARVMLFGEAQQTDPPV